MGHSFEYHRDVMKFEIGMTTKASSCLLQIKVNWKDIFFCDLIKNHCSFFSLSFL